MNKTVFDLDKSMKTLAEEDKNDQFERLIGQDIAFYKNHGHIPCLIATTKSLLERLSQIKTIHLSIPSLSSLAEVQADHLRLVERSGALIVVTMARQLIPANLSILLQHADLYSVPVLVLIDGITTLSNPEDFKAREQLIKEMPCAKFKYLDLQSISEVPSIEAEINSFIQLQSTEHREVALFEQRAKVLLKHAQSRLNYLSNYSTSLSVFKKDVDEYERRSILLVGGAISSSKAELRDIIQHIGSADPDGFIDQVIEYDNLEKRVISILQVLKTNITKTISSKIPAILVKMAAGIDNELKGTERDLSKLALDLSRYYGVKVSLKPEKRVVTLRGESLIDELNRAVDELVTAPRFIMLLAKYADSVGSKVADIFCNTINKAKGSDNRSETNVEHDVPSTGSEQLEAESTVSRFINGLTNELPENIIMNQLPRVIYDILASLVTGLTSRVDSFIETTADDVQDGIPQMYYCIKKAVSDERSNVKIRTDKINKIVDDLR